jgi:protein-disulfide isomerase
MLRVLYGAIIVVALLVGYRLYAIHDAKIALLAAPMGQSYGPDIKDAKSTIVELMDYRCSYCRQLAPVIEEVAKKHPETRIVIRHTPIFGAPSVREADYALAAGMQGKFFEAHKELVRHEQPLTETEFSALTAQLGLDADKLKKDMSGPETGDVLLKNVDSAYLLGIDSAPSFIINGRIIQSKNIGFLPNAADFDAWLAGREPAPH